MARKSVQNGNIDGALKKFKVKFARSGVPSELKKKKFHVKPGVERRLKKEEGIKNSHKKNLLDSRHLRGSNYSSFLNYTSFT